MARTAEEFVPLLRRLRPEALDDFYRLVSGYLKGETLDFDAWALDLARRKGFDRLTEDDVAEIVHLYRKTA